MKKLGILIALVCCSVLNTQAQDIEYGIKLGVNYANLGKDSNTDATVGFFIGGLADIPLAIESLHIQPELLFSYEGAKDSGIGYVRALTVAKYYIIEGLNVEAGPNLGVIVTGEDNITDFLTSLDYGVALGAGYELADSGLLFGIRYYFGLANISDVDGANISQNNVQLSAGYKF